MAAETILGEVKGWEVIQLRVVQKTAIGRSAIIGGKFFPFSQFFFSLRFFRSMAGNYSDKTLTANSAALAVAQRNPTLEQGFRKKLTFTCFNLKKLFLGFYF